MCGEGGGPLKRGKPRPVSDMAALLGYSVAVMGVEDKEERLNQQECARHRYNPHVTLLSGESSH